MAGAETIKEFLVSINWASNEQQQRKFVDAIEWATTKAQLLATSIEDMAKRVGGAVLDTGAYFQQLATLSERIHASATAMVSAQGAFGAVFGNAQAATQALVGLNEAIDKNPGLRDLLAHQGIPTKIDGVERDRVAVLQDIVGWLAKMPPYLQKQYEQMLGINFQGEITLKDAKEINRIIAERADSMARAGVTDAKIAQAQHFMDQWDLFSSRMGDVGKGALLNQIPALESDLAALDDWLKAHESEMSTGLSNTFADGLNMVTEMATVVGTLGKGILDVYTQLSGRTLTDAAGEIDGVFKDMSQTFRDIAGLMKEIVDDINWLNNLTPQGLLKQGADAAAHRAASGAEQWKADQDAEKARQRQRLFGPSAAPSSADMPAPGSVPNEFEIKVDGSRVTSGNALPVKIDDSFGHQLQNWLGGGGSIPGGGSGSSDSGRGGLSRRLGMGGPTGIDYAAKSFAAASGMSNAEYHAYLEGLTDIEGKNYGKMGGAGGRFAGRYQMGPAEIAETAARLHEPIPSSAQFLADPAMQERFMENYTVDHYRQLMRDPIFRGMSHEKQLEMLGYAHNQGVGGAINYLHTGIAGRDAWGTSGAAYFSTIHNRLAKLSSDHFAGAVPPPAQSSVNAPMTNHLTITGFSDPYAIAQMVGVTLDRTNQDRTRNLQGAVQ